MTFQFATNDSDDAKMVVEQARQMAERFKQPVAILFDLSTVLMRRNQQPYIEVVYPDRFLRGQYG